MESPVGTLFADGAAPTNMTGPSPSDAPTNVQAQEGWDAVVEDMEATATTYREQGWRALELHPGDSVLVDSDRRRGLDVLLPGPEFEELEAAVESGSFTDVEVFRAESGGLLYLLVVERDPQKETVVLVPAYYDPISSSETLESVEEDGTFKLFCRRLNDDTVEFAHDDPSPFLPETA
jgi:hypothetical protein